MNEGFYIDTCIWLNLFKKEGDIKKGKPYWQIARDFLNYSREKNNALYYSGFIINEIKHNLNNKQLFDKKTDFLKKLCKYISATEEDYSFARNLEQRGKLSFYDYIHIALRKRSKVILVTRDKLLLETGKKYVKTERPEDLF